MSKRWIPLIPLISLGGSLLWTSSGAIAAPIPLTQATLRKVINQVELLLYQKTARTAQVNDHLGSGDALKTARSSRAELKFNDGTLAKVGELATFRFTPNTRRFDLQNGTYLFLVPPGKGNTEFYTPNARAGVSGSALFLRYNAETDTTTMGALTNNPLGPMDITVAGVKQDLYAGQMAIIVKNRIERVETFDLRTFYNTSPLFKDVDLSDPDVQPVRQEISEALQFQVALQNGSASSQTPASLSAISVAPIGSRLSPAPIAPPMIPTTDPVVVQVRDPVTSKPETPISSGNPPIPGINPDNPVSPSIPIVGKPIRGASPTDPPISVKPNPTPDPKPTPGPKPIPDPKPIQVDPKPIQVDPKPIQVDPKPIQVDPKPIKDHHSHGSGHDRPKDYGHPPHRSDPVVPKPQDPIGSGSNDSITPKPKDPSPTTIIIIPKLDVKIETPRTEVKIETPKIEVKITPTQPESSKFGPRKIDINVVTPPKIESKVDVPVKVPVNLTPIAAPVVASPVLAAPVVVTPVVTPPPPQMMKTVPDITPVAPPIGRDLPIAKPTIVQDLPIAKPTIVEPIVTPPIVTPVTPVAPTPAPVGRVDAPVTPPPVAVPVVPIKAPDPVVVPVTPQPVVVPVVPVTAHDPVVVPVIPPVVTPPPVVVTPPPVVVPLVPVTTPDPVVVPAPVVTPEPVVTPAPIVVTPTGK